MVGDRFRPNPMVKVKICGITNLEDALNAIDAGCDALGFVFYKKSPRYIEPKRAKEIIEKLPEKILKIGVFVNEKEKSIRSIANLCKLDMLQFHGNESPEFCQKFGGFRVIKAFRVKDKIDLSEILRYNTFAYLFDAFVKSKRGGTGKRFNWGLLRPLAGIRQQIFLSGGINANNAKRAIQVVWPDWIDVSSSVEIRPGKKDQTKVKEFIEAVNNRDSDHLYA